MDFGSLDFIDIAIRGVRTLRGGKPSKGESLFEKGQNVVAALIVTVAVVSALCWLVWLLVAN